ncbi:---NA--- [Octopus vulgaris]|uniref:---NA n=1 Tax=Octopus vulgaris TaxID=6645 RepID=A0AA36AFJ1_OCTVU|nr:---NA--- [Octopus vulgaris]
MQAKIEELKTSFKEMDKNNDGVLTLAELMKAQSSKGYQEEVEDASNAMDEYGSKEVTMDEFIKFYTTPNFEFESALFLNEQNAFKSKKP